jgi:hypothetical protein
MRACKYRQKSRPHIRRWPYHRCDIVLISRSARRLMFAVTTRALTVAALIPYAPRSVERVKTALSQAYGREVVETHFHGPRSFLIRKGLARQGWQAGHLQGEPPRLGNACRALTAATAPQGPGVTFVIPGHGDVRNGRDCGTGSTWRGGYGPEYGGGTGRRPDIGDIFLGKCLFQPG